MKTIGQLSRATDCNVETIRYYEKRGLLPKPFRTEGGHRLYDGESEQRLQFIRRTRQLGFSLEEVTQLLELDARPMASCAEALTVAERHLLSVNKKLAELSRIKEALEQMTCECRSGCGRSQAPTCSILETLSS